MQQDSRYLIYELIPSTAKMSVCVSRKICTLKFHTGRAVSPVSPWSPFGPGKP